MKLEFRMQVPIRPLSIDEITRKMAAEIAAEEDKRFLSFLLNQNNNGTVKRSSTNYKKRV